MIMETVCVYMPYAVFAGKHALTAVAVVRVWSQVYKKGRAMYKCIQKRESPVPVQVIMLTQGIEEDFVLLDT